MFGLLGYLFQNMCISLIMIYQDLTDGFSDSIIMWGMILPEKLKEGRERRRREELQQLRLVLIQVAHSKVLRKI